MPAEEQAVFRRLAVFAGGWSWPPHAVLGADTDRDLLPSWISR